MQHRNSKRSVAVSMVSFTLILVLFISFTITETKADTAVKTRVLYLSPTGASSERIAQALDLDKENIALSVRSNLDGIDLESQTDFDVIVLNDFSLTTTQTDKLKEWLKLKGHGLLIVMGPNLTTSNVILDRLNILPGQTTFAVNDFEYNIYDNRSYSVPAISTIADENNHLVKTIAWNSAPELINYTQIDAKTNPKNKEIVRMTFYNGTLSNDSLIFSSSGVSDESYHNIIVFSGWISEGMNPEYQLWPYFNYLFFNAVQGVANKPIPTYGSWKYSPVPHLTDQIILGMVVLIAGFVSIYFFRKARKRGEVTRKKYEDLEKQEEEYLAKGEIPPVILVEDGSNLTIKRVQEESRKDEAEAKKKWEEIGFHRQQAGFLQMFFAMMFLIIPQLIVTSFIMPAFIQPHPQATGYYSFTLRFFEAIWVLFDMGTKYAFIKYFAEYRIEQPARAFHYAQIFVWWQFISGLVQIFIFTFMGSMIFTETNYTYLTWIFIAHSLVQYPGIFLVLQFFFQAMQKTDKQMIAFVLQQFLLRLIAQVITVPLFRAIYSNNIMYGSAVGAGIGLVVGQYLGDIILFLITIKWYKDLQFNFTPIFAAEFTKKELVQSLKFGAKMALGEFLVPAIWLLQVVLISLYVPSYAAEQGYFELAWTIASLAFAAALLYEGAFAALTEAHTYKKKTLLNYVTGASMRFGMFWTFFICSALWAIGTYFIIGTAGRGWGRAADMLSLLVFFNLLGPFSWQGDKEFASANRPELAGLAWVVEQASRAILLIILLPRFRVMEVVIYSYIISLAIKDILVWILIETKIHKHTWYLWPTFVAPGISAVLSYFLLRSIVNILPIGIEFVLLLFILTFFAFLYVYASLHGFFGGYDNNTLAELNKAVSMVTGVKGLAKLLYKATEFGAKISPLHNKFKIDIFDEYMKEAAELNAIKKNLLF